MVALALDKIRTKFKIDWSTHCLWNWRKPSISGPFWRFLDKIPKIPKIAILRGPVLGRRSKFLRSDFTVEKISASSFIVQIFKSIGCLTAEDTGSEKRDFWLFWKTRVKYHFRKFLKNFWKNPQKIEKNFSKKFDPKSMLLFVEKTWKNFFRFFSESRKKRVYWPFEKNRFFRILSGREKWVPGG